MWMFLINSFLFLLILLIIWWFWLYRPKATVVMEQDEMEILVKDGGYSPNVISATMGKTIKLHFILQDDAHCARTVLFPDFQITQELSKSHPETVELNLEKPGEYPFACPMGMYSGKILVSEAPTLDVVIEGGVYQPNLIRMKKGSILNLRFIRKDPSKCAEMVIFADLDIARAVSLNEPEIITLKPEKEGEYPFTCDMSMYKGKVIVE